MFPSLFCISLASIAANVETTFKVKKRYTACYKNCNKNPTVSYLPEIPVGCASSPSPWASTLSMK